jgi:hypothetical protein
MFMPRATKVSKRRRAKALALLANIVGRSQRPAHARVTAARTLVVDSGANVEREDDAEPKPQTFILPPSNKRRGEEETYGIVHGHFVVIARDTAHAIELAADI